MRAPIACDTRKDRRLMLSRDPYVFTEPQRWIASRPVTRTVDQKLALKETRAAWLVTLLSVTPSPLSVHV